MTIFVAIPFDEQAPLAKKVSDLFPGKHYKMPNGGFLIEAEGTSKTVSDLLEIEGNKGGLGRVLVTSASGYYGYGPVDMWEWLKLHWSGQQ